MRTFKSIFRSLNSVYYNEAVIAILRIQWTINDKALIMFPSRNVNVKCGAQIYLIKTYLVPFYFYIIQCGNEIYDVSYRKLQNNV